MKLLLVNDDGYLSPGIQALAYEFSLEHDVTVFAPESNRSGFSNSITIHEPVNVHKVDEYKFSDGSMKGRYLSPRNFDVYSVSGTPVDCAYIALRTIFKDKRPDFVISGINSGENMAEDTLYSGTVGAASEGKIFGIPSFAVSQQVKGESTDFVRSALIFKKIFDRIGPEIVAGKFNGEPILFNINLPPSDSSFEAIDDAVLRKIQFTRLGKRNVAKEPVRVSVSESQTRYLIGPHGDPPKELEQGTDLKAIAMGKISITPLQLDMTSFQQLEGYEGLVKRLKGNF